ncbi:MAG: DUF1629 domain-containing protein [Pseudomonadota bacterium]
MKVYGWLPGGNSGYAWSMGKRYEDRITGPYDPRDWIPDEHMTFEIAEAENAHGRYAIERFTDETRQMLPQFWILAANLADKPFDLVGRMSWVLHYLPIVSERFKTAIERDFPGVMEFIPTEKHWDYDRKEPFDDGLYYFGNILPRVPAWDPEKAIFSEGKSPVRPHFSIRPHGQYIRYANCCGLPIFRDDKTLDLLFSQDFVEWFQDHKFGSWGFEEFHTTDGV